VTTSIAAGGRASRRRCSDATGTAVQLGDWPVATVIEFLRCDARRRLAGAAMLDGCARQHRADGGREVLRHPAACVSEQQRHGRRSDGVLHAADTPSTGVSLGVGACTGGWRRDRRNGSAVPQTAWSGGLMSYFVRTAAGMDGVAARRPKTR
jgi:hypothetical protein